MKRETKMRGVFIGGLGACVSKVDILASTPEELMYLQGFFLYTIVLLKQ